jgi:hypothetical protein
MKKHSFSVVPRQPMAVVITPDMVRDRERDRRRRRRERAQAERRAAQWSK